MGHSVDPESTRQGARRRQLSTDLCTLTAVVRQRIKAHRRQAHDGRTSRPECREAREGGTGVEETARGTGRTGAP